MPPSGPTAPYGQPGPYGPQQPGFPGGPGLGGQPGGQPPKKKTGLIVGLSIAAVLVIGGAVALILVLTGDDKKSVAQGKNDPAGGGQPSVQIPGPGAGSSPGSEASAPPQGGASDDVTAVKELGEKAVQALNERDAELATEISCSGSVNEADMEDVPGEFNIAGEPTINGDEATIPVKLTMPDGTSKEGDFDAKKKSGEWCMT
jgi:hypothetical protein